MAGKTILVVDDNSDAVEVVRAALETNGFVVITASSGLEALSKATENLPDLVILDVMMPGMNGFEVLERLRSSTETAEIPVIFLTARDQHKDLTQGYRLGAHYYIVKPFTIAQLLYGINLLQSERESNKSHVSLGELTRRVDDKENDPCR